MGRVADRLTHRERPAGQLETDDGHEASELKNRNRSCLAPLDPASGRSRHPRRVRRDGNAQAAIDPGTPNLPSELES